MACALHVTWVVKVELAFERFGFLFWGQLFVKTILAEGGHLSLVMVNFILTQQLHNLLTD